MIRSGSGFEVPLARPVAAATAACALLLSGCEVNSSPEVIPTAPATTAPAEELRYPKETVRTDTPADKPLRVALMDVILVAPDGEVISTPSRPENRVKELEWELGQLTRATDGAVRFAQPKWFGQVRLTPSELEYRCEGPTHFFDEGVREGVDEAVPGYDPKDFDVTVIHVDKACESYQAVGGIADGLTFERGRGGKVLIFNRYINAVPPHEIAHVLGVHHTQVQLCTGKSVHLTGTETCTIAGNYPSPPSDPNSIMGRPDKGTVSNETGNFSDPDIFNSYQEYRLGSLPDKQVQAITGPGEYTVELNALLSGAKGKTRAVTIPCAHPGIAKALYENHPTYWLELSSDGEPGGESSVKLYVADRGNSEEGGESYLVPLSERLDYGATEAGLIFADDASGLRIELVNSQGKASTATVTLKVTITPK